MVSCDTARTKNKRILFAKCDILAAIHEIFSQFGKKRLEEVDLIVLKLMSHVIAGGD